MKIGIIGTGAFSVGVALSLAEDKENQIHLWSENKKLADDFKKNKKFSTLFKDKKMPDNIHVTTTYEKVIKDAELIFIMTRISYLDKVLTDIKELVNKKVSICIGTNGIDEKTGKNVYEITHKILKNKLAIMEGPISFNDDIDYNSYGFTLVSRSKKTRKLIKKAFSKSLVSIDESKDRTGVLLFGNLKNIYALGSGILNGTLANDNTKALYINACYKEMMEILYRFYGEENTLFSLAGFANLNHSCNLIKSSNLIYGEMIGKKENQKKLDEYRKVNLIEGLVSIEKIIEKMHKKHVKVPILDSLYGILIEKKDSKELVDVIIKK